MKDIGVTGIFKGGSFIQGHMSLFKEYPKRKKKNVLKLVRHVSIEHLRLIAGFFERIEVNSVSWEA